MIEGKKQTEQSWERRDTEHSGRCVDEGRTWHKCEEVCKSILCCSLHHVRLLNTVFVLAMHTVTLRMHTQQHLVPQTLFAPTSGSMTTGQHILLNLFKKKFFFNSFTGRQLTSGASLQIGDIR